MNTTSPQAFDSVGLWARIMPASSQAIRSWSYGIVTSSRLLDYDKCRFHDDGLFSERIFGPVRDFQCACGKYQGSVFQDIVCDVCGVSTGSNKLRKQRFGTIELRLPVVHPWWYGNDSRSVEVLTTLSSHEVKSVLLREVAIDFGSFAADLNFKLIPIQNDEALSPDILIRQQSGAEAIRHLLWLLHGEQLERRLREKFDQDRSPSSKLRRRLRRISLLCENKQRPENLVLEAIPVVPPAQRRIDQDASGRLTVDSLTRCYQRIVAIDRSLRRLIKISHVDCVNRDAFPLPLVKGLERRMRNAVERLFSELLAGRYRTETGNRRSAKIKVPVRPIWPGIEPIATSRATVVPDPTLRIDQCCIPRDAARELWKDWILFCLQRRGLGRDQADEYLKRRHRLVESLLDRLYESQPTLLNFLPVDRPERMMSFETKRSSDGAIHVHPLLASWLGFQFDGRQAMAWHTVSTNPTDEVEKLQPTVSVRNIATGAIQWKLAGDALLGFHLATFEKPEQRAEYDSYTLDTMVKFASVNEARMAFESGRCGLATPVFIKLPVHKSVKNETLNDYAFCVGEAGRLRTTVGRILFNDLLPDSFPFIDNTISHDEVDDIVARSLDESGPEATLRLIERLFRFGTDIMTRSGLSLSWSDFQPPECKAVHLNQAMQEVLKSRKFYERGIIAPSEANNRIHDVLSQAMNAVSRDLADQAVKDPSHPLHMISGINVSTGSRRLQELAGMIGRVLSHGNYHWRNFVTGCFSEGLSMPDYMKVASRARHHRVERLSARRDARRLTRRLANVAQNVVVTEFDCGTREGIVKYAPGINDRNLRPFVEQITGRISCEAIADPYTGETIVARSAMITPALASRLASLGIDRLEVRSPLVCESQHGVCQRCYGVDLRTGKRVEEGTAAGTLSALAIGSLLPGLRRYVYRTGYVPSDNDGMARTQRHGGVSLNKVDLAVNELRQSVALDAGSIELLDRHGRVVEQLKIPRGAVILVSAGDQVQRGDKLSEWNPCHTTVHAKSAGTVELKDLTPGRSMQFEQYEGHSSVWRVHDPEYGKHPSVRVRDYGGRTVDACFLPKGSLLFVVPDQSVDRGHRLAEIPTSREGIHDWQLGGIEAVDQLLSARESQRNAVLAEIDGRVERFSGDPKHHYCVWVRPCDSTGRELGQSVAHEIDMTRTQQVLVQEGDQVTAGSRLTSGEISARDLLRICGRARTGCYLLKELQKCFRGQPKPVVLDDRHAELIVAQMLAFALAISPENYRLETGDVMLRSGILAINRRLRRMQEIISQGDSSLQPGGLVSQLNFDQEVVRVSKSGGQLPTCRTPWPVGAETLLMSIDDVALRRDSFLTSQGFSISKRALSTAAIIGRQFNLNTVKDSIITGGLMPAGTGWRKTT